MEPPTNIKELCSFLQMVAHCRGMWPHRSQILAPLTSLLKVKEFQWGPKQQKAFDKMKALMATDAILGYPDHNLGFNIEANASDHQLGAVIKQNGRPVAHHSQKLSAAQKNYTTIEKELLSKGEMLHTFVQCHLAQRLRSTWIKKPHPQAIPIHHTACHVLVSAPRGAWTHICMQQRK